MRYRVEVEDGRYSIKSDRPKLIGKATAVMMTGAIFRSGYVLGTIVGVAGFESYRGRSVEEEPLTEAIHGATRAIIVKGKDFYDARTDVKLNKARAVGFDSNGLTYYA